LKDISSVLTYKDGGRLSHYASSLERRGEWLTDGEHYRAKINRHCIEIDGKHYVSGDFVRDFLLPLCSMRSCTEEIKNSVKSFIYRFEKHIARRIREGTIVPKQDQAPVDDPESKTVESEVENVKLEVTEGNMVSLSDDAFEIIKILQEGSESDISLDTLASNLITDVQRICENSLRSARLAFIYERGLKKRNTK